IQLLPEAPLERMKHSVTSILRRGQIVDRALRVAQQVEKLKEFTRMTGAQVIDQRPGLGVQVALITTTKSGVSHQPLQPQRLFNSSQAGKPQVMRAADPRPPTATNHFELSCHTFMQPVRERVVAWHQTTLNGKLVNHLVGSSTQINRATIQIQ